MNLDEYLSAADAPSASELAKLIGAPHVAQINQWRNPGINRRPSPAYCVAIERATSGAVTRRDLRPDDWQDIWPELAALTTAAALAAEMPEARDA